MRSPLRIIKLLSLILVLFVVSVGYRIFGGKEGEQKKSSLFKADTANADVPGGGGGGGCGCGEGGEGGGGCGEGSGGDS